MTPLRRNRAGIGTGAISRSSETAGNRYPPKAIGVLTLAHGSTSLAERGGKGIAIDAPWGVRTTGHVWAAVRPPPRATISAPPRSSTRGA